MGDKGEKRRGITVAPTEPARLKVIGRVSLLPERFGTDVLVPSLRLGIQRKAISDFVSSLVGDRLAKELLQMKNLLHKFLVIEGRWAWNADGEWINGFQKFTVKQYRGALYSAQRMGVIVVETKDLLDTVREIEHIINWVEKKSHTSLETRPKTLVSKWGTREDRDWCSFLMQGFDGIGVKQAKEIVKMFNGPPLKWTVTEKELQTVPGIGKERARRLMRALMPLNGRAES